MLVYPPSTQVLDPRSRFQNAIAWRLENKSERASA